MSNECICIIEDEKDIIDILKFNLERERYQIKYACSGEAGLELVKKIKPDLILLDLMLPGIDGFEVCRQIRHDAALKNLPIIMLTAKDSEADIVTGLELGANDYITKPFSTRILIARIRKALRQSKENLGTSQGIIKINDITLDLGRHEVFIDDKPVSLTPTEFKLLQLLSSRRGWVFDREQLINSLHDNNYIVTDRSIDVHFVGLRKKLGKSGKYIQTVRGVGYRLNDQVAGTID